MKGELEVKGITSYPRLMLAAPKSGSGKTMVTCGLLAALKKRGLDCRSFKCGPDYIDPMFHKYVLGIGGGNLDTFFLPGKQVREQFKRLAVGADISVIEGVMGYYDGVGGNSMWASSYDTACSVEAPVVLLLDCRGASLSLAAQAWGFLHFEEDSRIKGVILNRISPTMALRLTPEFQKRGITVYGYLPECQAAKVSGRHLGLVLPEELGALLEQISGLAEEIEKTVDLDGLLTLAREAEGLWERGGKSEEKKGMDARKAKSPATARVRIGIAAGSGFCFYYQENLELFESLGGDFVEFDPLTDRHLPKGVRGLLFGGGYPELYAEALSNNKAMLMEVRNAARDGIPILAECGGFMYLHDELVTKEGKAYSMAGIIEGRTYPVKKLPRFGYVELKPYEDTPFLKKGETIRGHEFHYWESTACGQDMMAVKPGGGTGWDCIHAKACMMAGFPHLYYPSNPAAARRFIDLCGKGGKK